MVPNRFVVILEVLKKELKEHLRTKRLLIFAIIFAIVFVVVAVYGNVISGYTNTDYTWVDGPNRTLSTVISFSSFLPAIMSIAMSYNAVSGERVKKSLILLISKPVDRSSIFIGKFLSSFLAISLVYVVIMGVGYGAAAGLYGRSVPGEDVVNAFAGIGIVLLGIAAWVSLTMMVSTILKNTTTCLVLMVILWIFVLPIVSQIGLIVYALGSSEEVERQPINVDLTVGSTSYGMPYDDLIFNVSRMDRPVDGVEVVLTNTTGAVYDRKLPFEGAQTIFIDVPPGRYSWVASWEEDSGEEGTLEEGTVLVDTYHLVFMNMSAGDDGNRDDLNIIVVNGTMPEFNATVVVRSKDGGVETLSGPFGFFQKKDLPKGRYEIEVRIGNVTIYKEAVHSYGDFKPKDFLAVLMGDVEDIPDYVTYSYAINPNSGIGTAAGVVEGDDDGGMSLEIITPEEGVASLLIFIIAAGVIGIIAFHRMDPN